MKRLLDSLEIMIVLLTNFRRNFYFETVYYGHWKSIYERVFFIFSSSLCNQLFPNPQEEYSIKSEYIKLKLKYHYLLANNKRSNKPRIEIFNRKRVGVVGPHQTVSIISCRSSTLGNFPDVFECFPWRYGIICDVSTICSILVIRTFILLSKKKRTTKV